MSIFSPIKCAFCKKKIDIETCVQDHAFRYCSHECKKLRERDYDRYVDPLGWYSNPNRIATHD